MVALLPRLFLEHFAGTSLTAEDDRGELAGFLVGFDSPDHRGEAYVHFVGVRPDQRGSGLGRALHDRFAREGSTWRFAERRFFLDLVACEKNQSAEVAAIGRHPGPSPLRL